MTESNQSVSAKQVKDAVALGKKISRTAFPNPTREGCPNSSTLRAMANRDPRLTLKDLPLSHVVTCSPCFLEYARLRWMSVLMRSIQVAAASLVVVATLFAAVRVVWNYTRGRGEPSISQERRARPQSRAATPQSPAPIPPLAMTVDLASFSPTRGEEAKDAPNKIHLPPKLLRVSLLLPIGMEPGEYALRLKDSAGIVLKEAHLLGRLNNGVTSLEVDLDFSTTSRGSFSLMIRPPGLSWRTFPVLVE